MLWLQIQNIFSRFKVACGHSRLASLPPPSRLFSQAFSRTDFIFHISVADWKNWDGPPIEFAASLMSMSLMKEALSHQSSNKIGYHVFISRFFPYPPWVTGFRVYCPSGTVPGIIVGWTRLWLKTSKVTSLCTASPPSNKSEGLIEGRERPFSFMIGQSFHFASGQWHTLFPLHLWGEIYRRLFLAILPPSGFRSLVRQERVFFVAAYSKSFIEQACFNAKKYIYNSANIQLDLTHMH